MSTVIVEIEEFALWEVHIHCALLEFVVVVCGCVGIVRHVGMVDIIAVILSVGVGIVISLPVMAAALRKFQPIDVVLMNVLGLFRLWTNFRLVTWFTISFIVRIGPSLIGWLTIRTHRF